jgi:anthranilate synthase component 1
MQATVVPSLETAGDVIARSKNSEFPPNLLPLTGSIPADLLTPTLAYLKLGVKCVISQAARPCADPEQLEALLSLRKRCHHRDHRQI